MYQPDNISKPKNLLNINVTSMLDVYSLTCLLSKLKIFHESISCRYHLYLLPCKSGSCSFKIGQVMAIQPPTVSPGIYLCPYGPELRTDQIDQSEESQGMQGSCPTCPSSLLIGPSTSATQNAALNTHLLKCYTQTVYLGHLDHSI